MWAVFPCANSFHYCFTAVMGPDRTAEGKGFGLVTPENPARSVLLSSTSNDDTIYVDISPVLGFLDYLTHNRRLVQAAVYFQDGFQLLSLLVTARSRIPVPIRRAWCLLATALELASAEPQGALHYWPRPRPLSGFSFRAVNSC